MPKPIALSRSSSKSRPDHHLNSSQSAFQNPWPSGGKPKWSEIFQMSTPLSWSRDLASNPEAENVEVVVPDWGAEGLAGIGGGGGNHIVGTWLGHASTMAQLPLASASSTDGFRWTKSLWFLFDPIFSMRAGPTQYTGPRRLKPPPCQVEDLPGCDAVLISHNHYDHLDLASIKSLMVKFPECRYFVPLGCKSWFKAVGVPETSIYQMDWWDTCSLKAVDLFPGEESGEGNEDVSLKFTAVPAQHTSGRGALDQNSTLWCGWAIEQVLSSRESKSVRRKGAIYYAGDTGLRRTSQSDDLCPAFAEIGQKLGPFDMSFVPIWRGGTLGFISSLGMELNHNGMSTATHVTPSDAISIHKAVRSRNTVPVHFGTFIGAENEVFEATVAFNEARKKEGVCLFAEDGEAKSGRTGILNIGGSVIVEIEEKKMA